MRRKPGMVLIILTMMTFVLSGCQSDEITGEEVTLEEEALQEGKGSGEEQADGESQEQREGAGKEQTGRTDEGKIWVYVCGQVLRQESMNCRKSPESMRQSKAPEGFWNRERRRASIWRKKRRTDSVFIYRQKKRRPLCRLKLRTKEAAAA